MRATHKFGFLLAISTHWAEAHIIWQTGFPRASSSAHRSTIGASPSKHTATKTIRKDVAGQRSSLLVGRPKCRTLERPKFYQYATYKMTLRRVFLDGEIGRDQTSGNPQTHNQHPASLCDDASHIDHHSGLAIHIINQSAT